MKARLWPGLILLLAGVCLSAGLSAHPENSPLTFIAHKTRDGRIIYTNIPLRCFENGVLICPGYHPMIDTRLPSTKDSSAKPAKPVLESNN